MPYSEEELNHAFEKSNGYCWWCGKKLVFNNYGIFTKEGWDIDDTYHVKNRKNSHLKSFVAACIECNRKITTILQV